MARFLVMTVPYPGHLAPSIPIIQKLTKRRHDVVWITGREYKEKIEATGARFHPLPKESDPNGMEIYDWHPELKKLTGLAQIKYWLKHVVLDACIQEIDTIEAVLSDFSADVFVGDPIAFSLCFVSEERRVPCAQISVFPLSLPSCDTAPFGLGLLPGSNIITRARDRLLNFITHNILLHDLTTYANKVRWQIGLELLNGPFFYSMFKKPTLVMVTSTPAFEYPRKDQPDNFQFIGPVLPEPDYKFHPPLWWSDLENPEPVILVNQGTLAKNLNDLIIPTIE